MYTDKFGQIILQEKDLVDLYLRSPEFKLNNALIDLDVAFSDILDLKYVPDLKKYTYTDDSIEKFDDSMQSHWHMPISYKEMDIAKYVLELCNTEEELQRTGEELLLFQERNLFDLLRYLKYLVDTMRENNVVWGVGRGSSVSSYVLYLLGVHKINSLYYDLSIDEFLK
jgi:DNA polymerase III alpha subunit